MPTQTVNPQDINKAVDGILSALRLTDDAAKREVALMLIEKLGVGVPASAMKRSELGHFAGEMVTELDILRARERLPEGTLKYARLKKGVWEDPDGLMEDPRVQKVLTILDSGRKGCLRKDARNEPIKGAENKTIGYLPVPPEFVVSCRLEQLGDANDPFEREVLHVEINSGRFCLYDEKHPVDENDVNSERTPYFRITGGVTLTGSAGYHSYHVWDWKKKEFVAVPNEIQQNRLIQGNAPAPITFQAPEPYGVERR